MKTAPEEKAFDLFISYATGPDFRFARRLESFLETFHRLPNPGGVELKPLEVCRDGSDFRANTGKGTGLVIEQYLVRSKALLVLCSVRARGSKWVGDEVRWFLEHRGPGAIKVAVTEGARLETLASEVFPQPLIDAGLHTAIAYDFRGRNGRASQAWESVRLLEDEMVRLAADLNDKALSEVQPLWFQEQRKRWRRTLSMAIGVAAALLLLAATAWVQRERAIQESERTRRQLYVSSIGLAERAWNEGSLDVLRDALLRASPGPGQTDLRGFEWHHLSRRLGAEVQRLRVAGVALSAVSMSRDAHLIALGGSAWSPDETASRAVYLFSPDGTLIRQLPGFTDAVQAVALHPGKPVLIAASRREIKAWDLVTFAPLKTGITEPGADHLVYSADGRRLAISDTGSIGIFDETFHERARFDVSDTVTGRPALSPDGEELVVGDGDGNVYRFHASAPHRKARIGAHKGGVTDAVWLPTAGMFATGSTDDRTVMLWPLQGKTAPIALKQSGPVRSLAVSPDNRTLAVGYGDPLDIESGRAVALWDLTTFTQSVTLRGPARRVVDLAFTADGTRLIGATEEEEAHIWNVQTAQFRQVVTRDGQGMWNIDFVAGGRGLVGAEASGAVVLWDDFNSAPIIRAASHSWRTDSVAFHPRSGAVVSTGRDLAVKLWEPKLASSRVLESATQLYTALRFSPDGEMLAASNCDGVVRLWETRRWSRTRTLTTKNCLGFVAWSPDGQTLAIGGGDPASPQSPKTILLWQPATNASIELTGAAEWPRCATYSPDGTLLASGHWNGDVIVWTVGPPAIRWTLRGHQGLVTAVTFSPDGTLLASAGQDGTVRFWDLETGQPRGILADGPQEIFDLRFTPDGNVLVAAGHDPGIVLWFTKEPRQPS